MQHKITSNWDCLLRTNFVKAGKDRIMEVMFVEVCLTQPIWVSWVYIILIYFNFLFQLELVQCKFLLTSSFTDIFHLF